MIFKYLSSDQKLLILHTTFIYILQPFEKGSRVYNLKFLNDMEKNYKTFLSEMRKDIHVLNYDFADLNVDAVMEDLELLDYDVENKYRQWRVGRPIGLNEYRSTLVQ